MANIAEEILKIRHAVYGEEVRESIVDALDAMNEQAAAAQEWATGADDPTSEPGETNNAAYYAAQAAAQAAAAAQATEDAVTLANAFYMKNGVDYSEVEPSKWIIHSANEWREVTVATSQARSYTLELPEGARVIEVTAGVNGATIALLNTYEPVQGAVPDYADGYNARTELSAGDSETYEVTASVHYLYVVLYTSDGTNMVPVVNIGTLETDKSLTKSGIPADAAAVGNKLEPLAASHAVLDGFYYDWRYGYYITDQGAVRTNDHYALSYNVPVKAGNIITNRSPDYDEGNRLLQFLISTFKSGVFYARQVVASGVSMVIPADVDSICITFGYSSTVSDAPDMSPAIIDAYFAVEIDGVTQPYGIFTDGEHPVYAAFGASTTEGLVYTYGSRSFSRYNYPNYVGRVLNLKTYNFGRSGSGFLERGDSGGNIMDEIAANGNVLERARLVTIVFGYGNDNMVGPSGHQVLFPIGNYTDYYPYDEEGYNLPGASGCADMVGMGATLMGCLNWCIKHINENYPYAQMVIVFGAPSGNSGRTVSMTAHTGSTGVAPYELSFADPYANPTDPTSPEYGIKQISTELAKLKAALNIPIVDLNKEGGPFTWYSTYAANPETENAYALFGTKGTAQNPQWDSHPNDAGYKAYARFLAGTIISKFRH